MNPDNDPLTAADVPSTPQRSIEPAITTPPIQPLQQQAAANVVRSQIDTIYDGPTAATPSTMQPTPTQLQSVNPYDRTHIDRPLPEQDKWKQYHSAWQTYYQKYYEGYYTHHLTKAQQALQAKENASSPNTYFADDQPEERSITKDEALYDLRQKLLERVQTSATKVRRSRHFVPITAAIIVVLFFIFLQYNRVFIANVQAYVSPGSIDPQNIVVDPSADISVSQESRLIIPKINVDVPVLYDIGSDYASQMKAMETGVAHFAIPGASSHPGQIGNTVIAGHSSNDLLDSGDYKFIFAQLDKLQTGDSMYANYQGKRYTYTITSKQVIEPTDVNKLIYPTDKPIMTLITCTPLGTALHRLLIIGEQVSPDPAASTAAPAVTGESTTAIPGNSPTFFERLFGG
jgi:sortase A